MRESSPALGGAIVGAVTLLALVYAMGFGHQFSDLMSAFAADLSDWFAAAYETVRQAVGISA